MAVRNPSGLPGSVVTAASAGANTYPKANGSGGYSWGAVGSGRSATLVVAASTASAASKAAADYVCDGTADDVEINAAMAALPAQGGKVYLTEGVFNLAAAIVPVKNYSVLEGSGIQSTVVNATNGANCNGYQYVGTTPLIFCAIKDILFEGNTSVGGLSGTNTTGYGCYINPVGATFTADATNASKILLNVSSFANIGVGTSLAGTGITGGPTVAGWIDAGGVTHGTTTGLTLNSSLLMSANASATNAGVTITPSSTFWDFYLRDVFFVGWSQDGYYSYDGHGFVLDHVLSEFNGGWGINVPTGSNQIEIRCGTIKGNGAGGSGGGIQCLPTGSIIAENEVANNTGHGIALIGAGVAQGNECYSNTLSGIYLTGSNLGARAFANSCYGNTQHGIFSDRSGVAITGNWLQGNSIGSFNFDEIQVQRGNTTVAFNYINSASQSRYGVNFFGTAFTGNVCYGNHVLNAHTSAYHFADGLVRAHDNDGFNPVGVVSPAVPASGVATTAQPYDQTFYITTGAGVTTVAISGGPTITLPVSGFAAVRVPATTTLTPTYTNAPTWVVEGE